MENTSIKDNVLRQLPNIKKAVQEFYYLIDGREIDVEILRDIMIDLLGIHESQLLLHEHHSSSNTVDASTCSQFYMIYYYINIGFCININIKPLNSLLKLVNIDPFAPKREQFDCDEMYAAYFMLCFMTKIEINDYVVFDFIKKCTLNETYIKMFLDIAHNLCPNKINYTGNGLNIMLKKRIKNYYDNKVIHNPSPIIMEDTVVFWMSSNIMSSDLIVALPFINAFKRRNMKIHVMCITAGDNPIFDSVINISDISNAINAGFISKYQYKYIVVVSHMMPILYKVLSMKIAQRSIGILGHLVDNALLDHFVVPHWDNESNYSENLIKLNGMAGGVGLSRTPISPIIKNKINMQEPRIAISLNGMKINARVGDMMERLSIAVPTAHFDIHLGVLQFPMCRYLLEQTHIKPYLDTARYTIYHDDKKTFDAVMTNADIIILPFPYTSYITISDIIHHCHPMVAMMETDRFSAQSAARIFELLNLNELIVRDEDEYVALVVRLVRDSEFYAYICNKIATCDYNNVVEKHNKMIENEFGAAIDQIQLN